MSVQDTQQPAENGRREKDAKGETRNFWRKTATRALINNNTRLHTSPILQLLKAYTVLQQLLLFFKDILSSQE